MIRIAVLGDIGSGKSYVAKQFGYPVFNADVEVSKLYKKSRKCYKKLKKTLPKYIVSFPIKKIEISKAIIDSQHNLKKIIKIIHPEIRSKMNNFMKKNKSKKIVILDIPLFMENRINKKNDILIFVDAKKKEIIVFNKVDMISEEEINEKINAFKKELKKNIYTISALKNKGLKTIKKILVNYVH